VQRLEHGPDDGRGGVESVEGGALGGGVLVIGEQREQFLADGLPGRILVAAGGGVREYRQGDRPKPAEAGESQLLLGRGGPPFLLDAFQGADGGDDVAGLGFLPACQLDRRGR
jgi:hypothetical protein